MGARHHHRDAQLCRVVKSQAMIIFRSQPIRTDGARFSKTLQLYTVPCSHAFISGCIKIQKPTRKRRLF